MIERDDRRRLGQPVALNDDEAEALPELLERGRQRRGADDKRPELQAEHADGSRGSATIAWESTGVGSGRVGGGGIDAQRVLLQHVEDLRHAHDHRNAPAS